MEITITLTEDALAFWEQEAKEYCEGFGQDVPFHHFLSGVLENLAKEGGNVIQGDVWDDIPALEGYEGWSGGAPVFGAVQDEDGNWYDPNTLTLLPGYAPNMDAFEDPGEDDEDEEEPDFDREFYRQAALAGAE